MPILYRSSSVRSMTIPIIFWASLFPPSIVGTGTFTEVSTSMAGNFFLIISAFFQSLCRVFEGLFLTIVNSFFTCAQKTQNFFSNSRVYDLAAQNVNVLTVICTFLATSISRIADTTHLFYQIARANSPRYHNFLFLFRILFPLVLRILFAPILFPLVLRILFILILSRLFDRFFSLQFQVLLCEDSFFDWIRQILYSQLHFSPCENLKNLKKGAKNVYS